ncbi:hypothetical protein IFM89_004256 [Coptis chinensis]|uniref:Uncharacterized protein n=1 Tax=Coptis chinensis TaxID=261450 RepID=A0A835I8N7_9MAGN|nr:hypothetical protein IFM89_004256 [Coptis chinensis]
MASLASARRKRILEKGADRLALITGRLDSLPSPSPSPSPKSSIYQSNAASQEDDDVASTDFARLETSNGSIRSASIDTAGRVIPQLRKCETCVDTTRTPTLDISRKEQPLLVPSTASGPSNSVVDEPGPRGDSHSHRTQIFTVNNFCSSISATSNIRLLSSMAIALLVVLSHLRIPLPRSNIIIARPVYLVLLTDVTILLAWLLYQNQAATGKAGK